MSRVQADQVIDEEEVDTCPLCIEDLDLQDRHFHPCPCGYQICFFCYNNIKSTMNGLCPACRRPYDDNPVFEQPTAEEKAVEKERLAAQAKKKAAARQKEAQKREADSQSRKHLAGIRVRQKNLVYVTGFRPTVSEAQLAETLRQEQYFGQYGRIVKIVVSKAKESQPQHSVGVYVTFEDKDAAARCIQAVDGVQNGDGRLRAQYGTTKYCSAYVRNEPCTNRNCMFLHEPGEENESFTRQDLSSLNVQSSQSHPQNSAQHTSYSSYSQAPPQQAPQYIAAAAPPTDQQEHQPSPSVEPKRPALPSTASWADKPPPIRKASQGPGTSISSPSLSEVQQELSNQSSKPEASETTSGSSAASPSASDSAPASQNEEGKSVSIIQKKTSGLDIRSTRQMQRALASENFKFVFDEATIQEDIVDLVKVFPGLFHPNGNFRRQNVGREAQRRQDNQVAMQVLSAMDTDDAPSGSLQLGGEPEDRELGADRGQNAIHPPPADGLSNINLNLDHALSPSNASIQSLGNRSAVPQQQQQFLLQQFKSASPGLFNQSSNAGFSQPSQLGHSRQTSRFSFANENSASTQVKPTANPKILSQQSSMMGPQPTSQFNQYQQQSTQQQQQDQQRPPPQQQQQSQQQQGKSFFSSGVQGPPPGLKATGTPPVSGGGMFGQGHGFATAGLGYQQSSRNANQNDEMMRELLRNRGGSAGSGQASDGGRHLADPSILHSRLHQSGGNSTGQGLYGAQNQGQGILPVIPNIGGLGPGSPSAIFNVFSPQDSHRATPPLPPGLGRSISSRNAVNDLPGLGSVVSMHDESKSPLGNEHQTEKQVKVSSQPQPRSYVTGRQKEKGKESSKDPAPTTPFEDSAFPALPKPSATAPKSSKAIPKATPVPVKAADETDTQRHESPKKTEESVVAAAPKPTDNDVARRFKRQTPSKLDTSAAAVDETPVPQPSTRRSTINDESRLSTPMRTAPQSPAAASVATDSRPSTPAESVATRRSAAPRTIRVLPAPKPETISSTLPVLDEKPIRSGSPSVIQAKKASRRPSVSSLSNAPGTPANERVSDNASVTTDSLSRANSPPPPVTSKVGSAAIRAKTKSQAKKERQERAQQESERQVSSQIEGTATPTTEGAVIQEPIVGRRRKARKPTPAAGTISKESASNTPTPSGSRAPSPKRVSSSVPKPSEDKVEAKSVVEEAKEERAKTPPPAAAPSSQTLTDVAKLLARLTSSDLSGEALEESSFFRLSDASLVALVRAALSGLDFRYLAPQGPLSAEEIALLDAGEPVRRRYRPESSSATGTTTKSKEQSESEDEDEDLEESKSLMSHLLITPARRCLHALPPVAQDRYLALEARIQAARRTGVAYTHRSDMLVPPGVSEKVTKSLKPFDVDELLRDKAAALMRPPTTTTAAATAAVQAAAAAAAAMSMKSSSHASSNADPAPGTDSSTVFDSAGLQDERYGDDALAYLNTYILPLHPRAPSLTHSRPGQMQPEVSRTSSTSSSTTTAPTTARDIRDAKPSVSTAIPRLYTTGNPTYSISGADLISSTQQQTSSTDRRQPFSGPPANLSHAIPNVSQGLPVVSQDIPTVPQGIPNPTQQASTSSSDGGAGWSNDRGTARNARDDTEGEQKEEAIRTLERALNIARKEHELIERRMTGLLRRNRRVLDAAVEAS